ncbi:bifunctional phosphoribosylaminoimidazolecarboxamide formyltransferase/IMP cyclohydrolase [Devriesea agamarum]|uniref:bifunctional phosphoribosylaminoimidazolecarboxamide formyltransferase/IMP cyclohydrolase n=1 Tax=Devriesea agamarum TaxID=472569 RepID=UPI000B07F1AE|nr:bifunctional phosphoribosylaminoimidazolecarboxamide formyltransferase/IMP cyclohydrolase [Devriesea agamarum]
MTASSTHSIAFEGERQPVRRALISVFDKTGVADLGRSLAAEGVELISTGSTAAVLREAGLRVREVSEVTGYPECLDGRVKTLHPAVHAGILADRRRAEHREQLADQGVEAFDLVVVNLYPFEQTVADGGTHDEVIEKIDIGGPTLLRGAAKNYANCAVVVDPRDYDGVAQAVRTGGFTEQQRLSLATVAFDHVADYDAAIALWMRERADKTQTQDEQSETFDLFSVADEDMRLLGLRALRYGENPHQRARLQWDDDAPDGQPYGLAGALQLGGKEMSYNNYVDADAAVRAALDHDAPCAVVMKHNNPCGIAVGDPQADDPIADAHTKAHATDPVSAYGGVIAVNRRVTLGLARQIKPVFTEVIVAPDYDEDALDLLRTKKNLRILRVAMQRDSGLETRQIWGGRLLQDVDAVDAPGDDPSGWTLVAGAPADDQTLSDLAFAWRAVRAPKSNAIVLAKGGAATGIGMGQVNRVDSCKLAIERANTLASDGQERARGSVAASDAFFPFADGPQLLIDAGVRAIVQPGGSIRDDEVIAACEAAGITMYVTGTRHFAH